MKMYRKRDNEGSGLLYYAFRTKGYYSQKNVEKRTKQQLWKLMTASCIP